MSDWLCFYFCYSQAAGLCCFFCFRFWLLDFWQQAFDFGFGAGACLLA